MTDSELVAAVRAGHREATHELLRRMEAVPRVLMAINVRLGWPLGDHEVEDVCQDTVERLWRKLGTFTGDSSLETWFYGVARFEYMNALRRKERRSSELVEPDEQPDPAVAPEYSDQFERVHSALARIAPEDAQIVTLHYFESQTLEQAARWVGIPVSTAKSRYYRGMERLAGLLRERSPREEA